METVCARLHVCTYVCMHVCMYICIMYVLCVCMFCMYVHHSHELSRARASHGVLVGCVVI
jgi:hypothetical protein